MFGNASQPSLNYSYHAKAPAENADLAYEQLRAAHRYRNKLCEIELERRAAVESALTELFPGLMELEKSLSIADAEVETLVGVAKSANAASKKLVADPLTKARIKAAVIDRRKALAASNGSRRGEMRFNLPRGFPGRTRSRPQTMSGERKPAKNAACTGEHT